MSKIMKRFIAGAVCPKCQLIDKLVTYRIDDQDFCECVRCDYRQQQEIDPTTKAVAKVGQREHVVNIIRPKKS